MHCKTRIFKHEFLHSSPSCLEYEVAINNLVAMAMIYSIAVIFLVEKRVQSVSQI